MKKLLIIAMVLSLSSCGRGYSEGERVGEVTKFSSKGIWTKTWEGELATNSFVTRCSSGKNRSCAASNVFYFTVLDQKIVADIETAMNSGKHIKISYVQWLLPDPFKMESGYEAVKVTVLEEK